MEVHDRPQTAGLGETKRERCLFNCGRAPANTQANVFNAERCAIRKSINFSMHIDTKFCNICHRWAVISMSRYAAPPIRPAVCGLGWISNGRKWYQSKSRPTHWPHQLVGFLFQIVMSREKFTNLPMKRKCRSRCFLRAALASPRIVIPSQKHTTTRALGFLLRLSITCNDTNHHHRVLGI